MSKFNEACVITFVLAFALLVVFMPAHAQECLPPDEAVAKVAAGHPIEQRITLDAEQAARVVVWWDAQPPVSEDHFDLAIILIDPANVIVLLMGKNGLVCRATRVPPEVVPSLLNAY